MVLAEFLAFLGAVTETILATSAVASALMALVLLWLYYRVLPEQRWVKYLGLAYSIFLFQYLLSWLAQHITPESLHSATAHAIQATSSALYNILLFMAAGALLAISKRQLTTIATASIAAIPIALILPDIWQRFPDKIVTFLCILALGRAFFVNLNSIGNPKLAHLAAATCLAYAALNLAYAYNPILTEANLYLNNQLSERLSQLGEILTGRQSTISNAYDAAVFTAAFPLRLAIFAAALALITRSLFMLSATAYRSMLRQVVDGEAEYLHSNGVVRAVGESFRANLSEICMRAPGSQKK